MDKCLAAYDGDSNVLNVAESTQCDEADSDKLDTQSAESRKAFVTVSDKSDTVESITGNTGTVDDVHSEAFSADADRLSTIHSTECADECLPDSSELHVIVDSAESARENAADAQQADSAAVNSVMSHSSEHTDTLHSLVSQLKLAISSAHSGNCIVSRVLTNFCTSELI